MEIATEHTEIGKVYVYLCARKQLTLLPASYPCLRVPAEYDRQLVLTRLGPDPDVSTLDACRGEHCLVKLAPEGSLWELCQVNPDNLRLTITAAGVAWEPLEVRP